MKRRIMAGIMSVVLAIAVPVEAMAAEAEEILIEDVADVSDEVEVKGEDESLAVEDLFEEAVVEESLNQNDTFFNEVEEREISAFENDRAVVIPVEELEMTGTDVAVVGRNYTYKVKVYPAKASNKVTWKVEPAGSGLSITTGGVLKVAKTCAVQRCIVTATSASDPAISVSKEVSINPAGIKSIGILSDGQSIAGKTIKLFRTEGNTNAKTSIKTELVVPLVGNKEPVAIPYTYTSSNENLVKIDADGTVYVTGNGTGKVTIKCTAKDGTKNQDGVALSKSFIVNVVNPVSGIDLQLTANRSKYVAKGKTITVIPTVKADFGAVSSKAVKFTSSNTTVATVNAKGVVTMKADSYSPVIITVTAADGSGAENTIELVACNVVKNISLGDISYAKANTNRVTTVSLKDGKLVLPVIFNDPDGGSAEKKSTSPDLQITSSLPKYLEVSYEDGYVTLDPQNVYDKKNIVVQVKMLDGSGLIKKWNFRVTE